MVPIVNREATANNILATMGNDKDEGASKRSTQYLGLYDGRHGQAASIGYDADWTPPESIGNKYEGKHEILGRCTGTVKPMKQKKANVGKYCGHESEYTRAGFDIYLKMRVRIDEEAQYGVNMCWLCMPIRKDTTIWNAQHFPAENEEMEIEDEQGETIRVVSQTNGKYHVNGVKV